MAGGVTPGYTAKEGRVYVRESGKLREVTAPITSAGADLAKFEAALEAARRQRAAKRARCKMSEH